ncbi:hypothetical protein C1H46_040523 [Malus baccata]|uniref:Uncharacterized protein n=1 Tax=Malus baccata TaxID=106549 RepID=A0A540KIA6_MALBA|nr:hypothetical protein C1H46_040523 [Malus baccata]
MPKPNMNLSLVIAGKDGGVSRHNFVGMGVREDEREMGERCLVVAVSASIANKAATTFVELFPSSTTSFITLDTMTTFYSVTTILSDLLQLWTRSAQGNHLCLGGIDHIPVEHVISRPLTRPTFLHLSSPFRNHSGSSFLIRALILSSMSNILHFV